MKTWCLLLLLLLLPLLLVVVVVVRRLRVVEQSWWAWLEMYVLYYYLLLWNLLTLFFYCFHPLSRLRAAKRDLGLLRWCLLWMLHLYSAVWIVHGVVKAEKSNSQLSHRSRLLKLLLFIYKTFSRPLLLPSCFLHLISRPNQSRLSLRGCSRLGHGEGPAAAQQSQSQPRRHHHRMLLLSHSNTVI